MKSTGARPPPEPPVTRPGVTPAGEVALGRVGLDDALSSPCYLCTPGQRQAPRPGVGLCVDRDELLVPGVRAPTLVTTRPSAVGSGGGK